VPAASCGNDPAPVVVINPVHVTHLIAGDPDFVVARAGVHSIVGSARLQAVTFSAPGSHWRGVVPPTIVGSLRSRARIERSTPVMWHCQGEYRALHIPGRAMRRHRWHFRLDVALEPDCLVIAGNGQVARIPVAEMVLVTYERTVPNAVRIDLVVDDFVRVVVPNAGELVEGLRSMIWDFEKQFLIHDPQLFSAGGAVAVRTTTEHGRDGGVEGGERVGDVTSPEQVAPRGSTLLEELRQRRQRMIGPS
jgi:hypothetical protein